MSNANANLNSSLNHSIAIAIAVAVSDTFQFVIGALEGKLVVALLAAVQPEVWAHLHITHKLEDDALRDELLAA